MKQEIPDFDTLLHMAQEDPDQLEELRTQLTRNIIDHAPEHLQPRLRGLQFQIDAKCRIAKTPLAACVLLSEMMHNSFIELYEALQNPLAPNPYKSLAEEVSNADVLMFPVPQ